MPQPAIAVLAILGAMAGTDPAPEAGSAAEPPPAVDAFWVERRVEFDYMGLTSLYSCDSMREKLVRLLKLVGARRDIEVTTSGCADTYSGITPFIHARLHFHSPRLSKPADHGIEPTPAPSHWTPVRLEPGYRSAVDPGDCELVEQFDKQLLKYFEVRNVESRFFCVPHALPGPGAMRLNFEALVGTHTAQEESIQLEQHPAPHDDKMKSERH